MNNTIAINQIITAAKTIDPKKIAEEVLDFVASNVSNFIDNHERVFKIDLVIDSSKADKLAETKKLQDLYYAIPEEKTVNFREAYDPSWIEKVTAEDDKNMASYISCRDELDKITTQAYAFMCTDEERKYKIFKEMSYYFEVMGTNKGEMLFQELEGAIGITKFEYEAFSVPVTVTRKEREVKVSEYSYTVPESFTFWMEISFRRPSTSMF